jgi:hypothetical protein
VHESARILACDPRIHRVNTDSTHNFIAVVDTLLDMARTTARALLVTVEAEACWMQNLGGRARIAIVTTLMCGWAFLAYACSVDDENPAPARVFADSGNSETGVDPNSMMDANLGAPICGKYGGYANVQAIADAVLVQAKADCRISAPLANLNGDEQLHLQECFRIFMGGAFQCDGISYVSGTTKDSMDKTCRDMTSAHKGLNLRKADFDAFIEAIAAALVSKGVSMDDIRAIAPAFEGTRSGVTQNNTQPDKNTYCSCPGTPPQYMGKNCLPEAGIVDSGITDTGTSDSADAAEGG